MKESFVVGREDDFFDYAEVDRNFDEEDNSDTKEMYRVSQQVSDEGWVHFESLILLFHSSCLSRISPSSIG